MIILDRHFKYLSVQRGEVSRFADDPQVWQDEYEKNIQALFDNIKPFLPKECETVIDIGSGLGGIDVLINQHFGGNVFVTLVDGLEDPPEVVARDKTHNSMKVAIDFHARNGTSRLGWFTPEQTKEIKPYPSDLIVSFSAYCFHIAPQEYMQFITNACKPETVLIFDVRKNDEYTKYLDKFLDQVAVIEEREKFNRIVYKPKEEMFKCL